MAFAERQKEVFLEVAMEVVSVWCFAILVFKKTHELQSQQVEQQNF